jgi:hypothetical protein
VIHLDTKDWISLAKGYYDQAHELQKIVENAIRKSELGRVIFPLSLMHFDETVRNLDPDRRKRLANFMILTSRGWGILPASTIIEPEIRNACRRVLGLPLHDLQRFAIGRGLGQLVGAKPTLVYKKDAEKVLPDDLKKKFQEIIEDPKGSTLLFLMEHGVTRAYLKEQQQNSLNLVKRLEKIRSSDSGIRDNNLRRRVALAKYFATEIDPKVVEFLLSVNADPKSFANKVFKDLRTTIRFFQLMPTSYCLVQLTLFRDMQKWRKIQPNDLYDIMSLSIAIPYSDIVVTERMWQTAIVQTKLDKLYRTTVLKSVRELGPILELC